MILVPKWWSVSRCYLCEFYAEMRSCRDERETLTENWFNRETCWSRRFHSISELQTCTFAVGFWVVHGCLPMRYIHNWLGGSGVQHMLDLSAVVCLVGCCVTLLMPLPLVVNATMCRGPWASVVYSVRCFGLLGKWRTTLGSREMEYF